MALPSTLGQPASAAPARLMVAGMSRAHRFFIAACQIRVAVGLHGGGGCIQVDQLSALYVEMTLVQVNA